MSSSTVLLGAMVEINFFLRKRVEGAVMQVGKKKKWLNRQKKKLSHEPSSKATFKMRQRECHKNQAVMPHLE